MIPHSRPTLSEEDVAAVVARLRGGMIAEGSTAEELEQSFRDTWAAADAVAVGSGSQALLLAMRAVGVVPGSEVILPTYVCAEVLGIVEALGARPAIADVGEDYLLDPAAAAAVRSERTAAVLLPMILGRRADVAPYRHLDVPVVADMAQFVDPANTTGDLGDVLAFSFEATKLLAAGEGGLVLARDPAVAQRLRDAKTVSGTPYKLNLYPLSDLQAVLALAQWRRLPAFLRRRAALAERYAAALAAAGSPRAVMRPDVDVRFLLKLSTPGKLDAVIADCAAEGVAVRRPVDCLLHWFRPAPACPKAEDLYDRVLSLPLYPSLSDADQERVIDVVEMVLAKHQERVADA